LSSSQVVHIIDDDTDVLEALTFLLTAAGLAVQVHESAVAFLNARPRAQAGCIVTDIGMPGMDGLELQRKLRADLDDTPVILMTGHADVALAVEAMKAGAFSFFEKPFDNEILLEAIQAALARRNGARARKQRSAEVRRLLKYLSERERQVLDGLVAGKSNKTIADDLSLSPRMIEGYRAGLMTKLEADSLSALIRTVLADPSAI
jgi:two-component system, LuxR family, response regulator FixJ